MFDVSPDAGLWGLLASAFLSATILPGNSEVVLVALLAKYPFLFWQAIAIATVGNTLGGMTSYAAGRLLPRRIDNRAMRQLQRHGEWALLFSWVPVVGDALCVAAGWLRLNAWVSLAMLAIGKGVRYVLLAGGASWIVAHLL
ncbi:MAG: DedA family protein [Gemmatimonadetes bacterium]|nr:DedA family protein [Gemmatimonadota bacterium]